MTQAALVTGAGSRLGRAMAVHLARRGYDVAVHYASNANGAEDTAREIRSHGVRTCTLKADLLDEGETQALIRRATDAIGPLSVLVNNASIFERDDITTASLDSWERHMGSNLRAPFVLTQSFAQLCPDLGTDEHAEPIAAGLIVNMIDQRVLKLTPEFITYTLAKSALWTLTQTSAQALAPKIRVNAIGPGPTLKGPSQSEAQFSAQRAATVLQRGADPTDITAALDYLMTAKSVTGQLICVDGGQHLSWQTPDVVGLE